MQSCKIPPTQSKFGYTLICCIFCHPQWEDEDKEKIEWTMGKKEETKEHWDDDLQATIYQWWKTSLAKNVPTKQYCDVSKH